MCSWRRGPTRRWSPEQVGRAGGPGAGVARQRLGGRSACASEAPEAEAGMSRGSAVPAEWVPRACPAWGAPSPLHPTPHTPHCAPALTLPSGTQRLEVRERSRPQNVGKGLSSGTGLPGLGSGPLLRQHHEGWGGAQRCPGGRKARWGVRGVPSGFLGGVLSPVDTCVEPCVRERPRHR